MDMAVALRDGIEACAYANGPANCDSQGELGAIPGVSWAAVKSLDFLQADNSGLTYGLTILSESKSEFSIVRFNPGFFAPSCTPQGSALCPSGGKWDLPSYTGPLWTP